LIVPTSIVDFGIFEECRFGFSGRLTSDKQYGRKNHPAYSRQVIKMEETHHDFHSGFVALVGAPNAGKSTLMNHVLGVKVAITSPKPQTTRNRILGVRTYPNKGQLCFVDTPGLHESSKRLNKAIIKMALDALQEVDLIVHVVDVASWVAASYAGKERLWAQEEFVAEKLANVEVPVILALNKVDLVTNKEDLLPALQKFSSLREFAQVIPLSARDGANVESIVEVLLAALPEQEALFPEDMVTDQAEKFIAAEFVRQEIMKATQKEIPYSVAVEIERFADGETGTLEISAVVHVERSSQKGIIIGQGGARMKVIATAARLEMERFFGRKVFLETFVRVESNWSENPRALNRFGYES